MGACNISSLAGRKLSTTAGDQSTLASYGIVASPPSECVVYVTRRMHLTATEDENPAGATTAGTQLSMRSALLATALLELERGCPVEERAVAARTLTTLIGNAWREPRKHQYRRIRLENKAFASR